MVVIPWETDDVANDTADTIMGHSALLEFGDFLSDHRFDTQSEA
ncbi:hypothetical protein VIBNIAM115_1300011 [Vibrio nigripulchritudo AM115]|nr:hypothetical protein VIBNIAM115_1300011 [Vibrio nigripulchritudo AM115]